MGIQLDESVKSISNFDTDLLVKCVAKGIRQINKERIFPPTLPPEMSARFRACSNLADALKELGFPDDIGYQVFLYPNDKDSRKILMWMVEAVAKPEAAVEEEIVGTSATIRKAVAKKFTAWDTITYGVPIKVREGLVIVDGKPYPKGTRAIKPFRSDIVRLPLASIDSKNQDNVKYCKTQLALCSHQTRPLNTAATLLEFNRRSWAVAADIDAEWNTLGMASGLSSKDYWAKKRAGVSKRMNEYVHAAVVAGRSGAAGLAGSEYSLENLVGKFRTAADGKKNTRFMHELNFGVEDAEDESTKEIKEQGVQLTAEEKAELERRRKEEELAVLRAQLDEILALIQSLEQASTAFGPNMDQVTRSAKVEEERTAALTEECKMKKKIMDLLPEADKNIKELRLIAEGSSARLVELAAEWEKHRGPLVERYRVLREEFGGRKSEYKLKLERIKEMREEVKAIAEEIKAKDELYRQLLEEYKNMPKDINRSVYTRRILEIIRNVKKQKQDIDKVLIDTRSIMLEINQSSDALKRTFVATDELIFKEAKSNPANKQAYKYLVTLHEDYGKVVNMLEETVQINREAKDLEVQIELITSRNTALNMERIASDLKAVKQENKILTEKVAKGNLLG